MATCSCTRQKVHTALKRGQIPVPIWLLYSFLRQGPIPGQEIRVCESAITDQVKLKLKHLLHTKFQKLVVTKADKEACSELGFLYYIILAKMHDLDPKADKIGKW